jgi:hypothetical protein
MRRGGPFVVSLRFNPLESISFIVCAVEDDSVFAAGLKVVVWVPKACVGLRARGDGD